MEPGMTQRLLPSQAHVAEAVYQSKQAAACLCWPEPSCQVDHISLHAIFCTLCVRRLKPPEGPYHLAIAPAHCSEVASTALWLVCAVSGFDSVLVQR